MLTEYDANHGYGPEDFDYEPGNAGEPCPAVVPPRADAATEAVREAAETMRSEAELTRDDAMTLIGHAEYLRKCHGEEDMPRFFDALAQKILALSSPPRPGAQEGEKP